MSVRQIKSLNGQTRVGNTPTRAFPTHRKESDTCILAVSQLLIVVLTENARSDMLRFATAPACVARNREQRTDNRRVDGE